MIININSGSNAKGWSYYVVNGTKAKPRNKDLIELIEGDFELGDYLCDNNKYEDSYYSLVLGFQGKPDKEIVLEAYEDFKKHFFIGLNEDEYHIDSIFHFDTDDTHIHIRISKQNLLTNTHLQLYYDKIDRPRKELIQDYISLKYGFEIARETNKEIVKEQNHEHITKWREERGQEPFNFSNKKNKDKAQSEINTYISGLITSNLIEKREDITTVLEELELEVIKDNGLDLKKDFAYITVQNETGKMRVKGEFYHDRFWEHNTEDRRTQIESNQRIKQDTEPNRERFERVSKQLNKANEKRFNRVTELFEPARQRAYKQIDTTTSKAIELNKQSDRREVGDNTELTKNTHNEDISYNDNFGNNSRSTHNFSSTTISKSRKHRQRLDSTPRAKNELRGEQIYNNRSKQSKSIEKQQRDNQISKNKRVENDIDRTTTFTRDRTVRRKRIEALRKIRQSRIEFHKSLRRNYTELQERAREIQREQQLNIKESTDHIEAVKTIEPTIGRYTRFKERVTNYIKSARSYLKDRFQSYIDRFENFKYKLDSSQEFFNSKYKQLQTQGKELTFQDLKRASNEVENNRMYDISQTNQELERGNNRIKELFNKLNITNSKIDNVSEVQEDLKTQVDKKYRVKKVKTERNKRG